MDKMKVDSEDAFNWVEELAPNTWIKAFLVIYQSVICCLMYDEVSGQLLFVSLGH
jgi:hypothetical protein